jgi:hypothetical protein
MTDFIPITPTIIGLKRTRSNENISHRIDIRRIIDSSISSSSNSNSSNDTRRIIHNGSNTNSISSNSFGNESLECSSWKVKYEDEQEKNTLLNLQLCHVQSECQRMLQLQSEIAASISTLQVFLTDNSLELQSRFTLNSNIYASFFSPMNMFTSIYKHGGMNSSLLLFIFMRTQKHVNTRNMSECLLMSSQTNYGI